MHNGTIEAASEGEGKGATFTVFLPLRSSPAFIDNVKSETGNSMNNEGKLKNLWILIVDDEADARDMVSFMLQINGARVTTARSAVEALEVLKGISDFQPTPDVIISDIGMPNEDGYALIQKIRALPAEQGSKIPAIALTAFNRPEDKRNALDAGFQLHLGKPIEPEQLVSAISQVASYRVL
jgi:CheY-like chemotaxis protein